MVVILSKDHPTSLLVAVVDDNILLRSASDGIVMLEEANGPSRIHQQPVIWNRVASFHSSMPSICNCQAVEDFCPPWKEVGKQLSSRAAFFMLLCSLFITSN